jgi:hypothetical protein
MSHAQAKEGRKEIVYLRFGLRGVSGCNLAYFSAPRQGLAGFFCQTAYHALAKTWTGS